MTPIHIEEKFLAENPHLAEQVRQAEQAQTAPQKDAPGRPESGDQDRSNGLSPTRPASARKTSYSWLIPVAALLILIMGGIIYAMGHFLPPQVAQASAVAQYGQTSPLVAAMQGDLNRVTGSGLAQDGDFGPGTLSALHVFERQRNLPQTQDLDQSTWGKLQAAASAFTAGPSQQTQAIATPQATPQQSAPAATIAPTSVQPAQGTADMTVEQYYAQINMAPGGEPLGANPRAYKEESIYIPGGTYTFKGPAEQVQAEWSAAFNLPVSAFENSARPPITGQMVGNDLPVTLEVSGPNGTKTIQGKIDSGTVTTAFPDSFLRSLGYSPVSTESVLGVTGQQTEGVYDIPYIQVRGNSGQWETLYSGTLEVWGCQFNEALVGADVLKQASLSVNGSTFILSFPH